MPDPFSALRVNLHQIVRDLFGVYDAMGGDEIPDRDAWFRNMKESVLRPRAGIRDLSDYARELARWLNARKVAVTRHTPPATCPACEKPLAPGETPCNVCTQHALGMTRGPLRRHLCTCGSSPTRVGHVSG